MAPGDWMVVVRYWPRGNDRGRRVSHGDELDSKECVQRGAGGISLRGTLKRVETLLPLYPRERLGVSSARASRNWLPQWQNGVIRSVDVRENVMDERIRRLGRHTAWYECEKVASGATDSEPRCCAIGTRDLPMEVLKSIYAVGWTFLWTGPGTR
jgi:hypothetical protein